MRWMTLVTTAIVVAACDARPNQAPTGRPSATTNNERPLDAAATQERERFRLRGNIGDLTMRLDGEPKGLLGFVLTADHGPEYWLSPQGLALLKASQIPTKYWETRDASEDVRKHGAWMKGRMLKLVRKLKSDGRL